VATTLIIGIGNPSRGDDALGPLAIEALEALNLPGVECLTDFQLQVEHALDLEGRSRVIFIDAAASGQESYQFGSLTPTSETLHTTHALPPEAVLGACIRIGIAIPSQAHVLGIRGYCFELGDGLSPQARINLKAALIFLKTELARYHVLK
jgi:hydrogenase maturation protease